MEAEHHHPSRTEDDPNQRYEVLKELGDCHVAMGHCEQARQYYLEAASLAPEQSGPYVGLGVIGIQAEQLDEALKAFELARRMEPECAEAYGGLAMVYQQKQDYPAALEMYLKCLELDTDNLVALLGLFQTSCEMGTFSKIIHYLEIYLENHPGDVSVLFCLATLYARDGRLWHAREMLLDVLALEPNKTEAANLLAEVKNTLATRVSA